MSRSSAWWHDGHRGRPPGPSMTELLRTVAAPASSTPAPITPTPPAPAPGQPPSAATRCGRCSEPATTTARFSYEGTTHELDLCEDCGESYERALLCWVRVAHEPRRAFPRPSPPPMRTGPVPAPVVFSPIRRPERRDDDPALVVPFLARPARRETGYTYTSHARDRMAENHLSKERVDAAIAARTVVRPGNTDDEEVIYHDGLKIVLGKRWHTVVTVSVRDLTEATATHNGG